MTEIIYSKYSNERSPQFAVRTDIVEDGSRRFVRKQALYEEGKAHEQSLLHWYEELTGIYREGGLCCNHCEKVEEGVLLEYLKERTLEEKLDLLLETGEEEQAAASLTAYLQRIQQIHAKQKFVMTEEFQRIFGKVSLPENLLSSSVTNIDLVCGNLVLTEIPTVIDYEWTFSFPIPVQYVLYRVIHYYVETYHIRSVLRKFHLYEKFGIDAELLKIFAEMEQHFQVYITGKHIPVRELFPEMDQGTQVLQIMQKEQLQIFFEGADGYREEHSRKYLIEETKVSAVVQIPEGCRALRIDPGEEACAIKLELCTFDGKRAELEKAWIPEGYLSDNWLYIARRDPNIMNLPVPPGAQKLEIVLQVIPGSEDMLKHVIERDRYLKHQIRVTKDLLCSMKNTRIWKLYEKYRNFVERK